MAELYDEGIMLDKISNGVNIIPFRVIRVKEDNNSKIYSIMYDRVSETPFMTINETELNSKCNNGEMAILDIVENGYLSELPNEEFKKFINPLIDNMIPKLKEELKHL